MQQWARLSPDTLLKALTAVTRRSNASRRSAAKPDPAVEPPTEPKPERAAG
jgi:hypothetical protein